MVNFLASKTLILGGVPFKLNWLVIRFSETSTNQTFNWWLVNLPPTKRNPPRNKALLRAYQPLGSLNTALFKIYF